MGGRISESKPHDTWRVGLVDLIERTCDHASLFAGRLSAAGYEILNDVVINQVLVDFGDEEKTQRIIDGVQADGTCCLSATTWHGKSTMRISVSSWATTSEDVERSVAAILKVAAEVGYPYGDAQHLLEPDKINRGRAEKLRFGSKSSV